jgi:hypothetical protein
MTGRLLPQTDLTSTQRALMLALMQEHFIGVSAERFDLDLSEKNWVILLEDERGHVRGFSTQLLYTTEVDGKQVRVVYSGDTIVHRDAWGSNALARTWVEAVYTWQSDVPLYWLLITSGFRTYRFLSVFWKEFWPRYDSPSLPTILTVLAGERFGDRYDSATGIVRFAEPQMLRNGLKEIPPNRLGDPHVDFFVRVNPGYARGDELVCLCPLTRANQTPAGRKLLTL